MKISEDSYALIYLCGPKEFGFYFGIFVFLFQFALQLTLLLSIVVPEFDSNGAIADGSLNAIFPADIEPIVRISQFVSLIAYAVFADESMKDIITAIETFPATIKDVQEGDRLLALLFAELLRLIQGLGAATATFFLVFTSITTRDVILNFLAVNFISALDDIAFKLADARYYLSKALKEKAQEAQTKRLPNCILGRKYPFLQTVVGALIFIAMMSGGIYVSIHQILGDYLDQGYFRIQIDEKGLEPYQGCYKAEKPSFLSRLFNAQRFVYEYGSHNEASEESAVPKFGYCSDDRRWNLFVAEHDWPCDIDDSSLIAHSSETTDYEIRNTIGDPWFSADGALLDIKFITKGDSVENAAACSAGLQNGICDSVLNTPGFDWDGGDCCAATCDHPKCGTGAIETAFNTSKFLSTAFGYQNCNNPEMVSISVSVDFPSNHGLSWIMISLDCDGINHLMVHFDPRYHRVNQTETIKVPDEATCKLLSKYYGYPSPKYAIYHSYDETLQEDTNAIVIWTGESYTHDFKLKPNCYLQTLAKYVDLDTAYANFSTPQNTALELLANDTVTTYSECDHPFFLDRFALIVVYLSMAVSSPFDIGYPNATYGNVIDIGIFQCSWGFVACLEGNVNKIDLFPVEEEFKGSIPSDIALLTNMERIDVSSKQLKGSIPSEIGLLSNIEHLNLCCNELEGSIPTEIGMLTNVEGVFLEHNTLGGRIPTEIGLLTNLKYFFLQNNTFSGTLPTEIGLLTNLESLRLLNNNWSDDLDPSVCESERNITKWCVPCSFTPCPHYEIGHCDYTTPVRSGVSNQNHTITTSSLESSQNKITVRLDIRFNRYASETVWVFHQNGSDFEGDGKCANRLEELQWRLYLDPGEAIFEFADLNKWFKGNGYTIFAEYPDLEDVELWTGDGTDEKNRTIFIPTKDMAMNGNFPSLSPSSKQSPTY